MRLKNNVFAVTGLMHPYGVNTGFVITKKHVVAIDSSWYDVSAEFIIGYIEELTKNPISYLILTEYHSDHVFGMEKFKAKGAKIIAHQRTKEFLEQHSNYQKTLKILYNQILFRKVKLCGIDRSITRDTVLEVDGEKIVILTTPWHTDSNLSVWIPKAKVLFAGDTLYSEFKPTTRFGNPKLWKAWIKSLEKIKKLDVKILVPGHGRILKGSKIWKEIARHKEYLKKKLKLTFS